LNNKSIIGAMFICTALICATITYFLSGIVSALKPNIDMMRKTWMYVQLEAYTSYWLIAAIVLLAAAGIYLLLEKKMG
jgi:hypothetical protein